MKKIMLSLLVLLVLGACNDASMDRLPLDSQTETTIFKNYNGFKIYAWSLYDIFSVKTNVITRSLPAPSGGALIGYYDGDEMAAYLTKNGYGSSYLQQYAFQTATVPATGGGWDFTFIRNINLMLQNIDASPMSQNEKDHWKAVGLFFHSYNYIELIMRFGDVPWIDKVFSESDALTTNVKRIPRKEAADKVLANLKWAADNINKSSALTVDGTNTINKNVVLALINRYGLWEGTWRKYHSLGDWQTPIQQSIDAGKELMTLYPVVGTVDYDLKFNSESLSTYPGMILYKEYVAQVLMTNNSGTERSSTQNFQMHKATVELYLTKNGLPIKNAANTQYWGDKTMYDEFRDRDFRLLCRVTPPYRVTGAGNSQGIWGYTTDPKEREYIDYMKANSRPTGKQLPVMTGGTPPTIGNVIGSSPHFSGQDAQIALVCSSGYYMWPCFNLEEGGGAKNTFDKPIFAMEEVLLNYAEAKCEMGAFDQSVADATINKLRPRAKVANMVVANINATFDPARDPSVTPLMWEIRRERICELMVEGFGFYDIRRWKVAPWFINKQQFGVYVRRTDLGGLKSTILINGGGTEGYVYLSPDPIAAGKGWLDTYYLFPIPRQELTLNPELKQNPGWQ